MCSGTTAPWPAALHAGSRFRRSSGKCSDILTSILYCRTALKLDTSLDYMAVLVPPSKCFLFLQHYAASPYATYGPYAINNISLSHRACAPTPTCMAEPITHSLQAAPSTREAEVLSSLRVVIDPDFGEDIVSCGFVKEMAIDEAAGSVSFVLELTTPACPVKDMFQRQSIEAVKVARPMIH